MIKQIAVAQDLQNGAEISHEYWERLVIGCVLALSLENKLPRRQ